MIKIVDFGIAKASSNEQKTQAGVIKGKLAYMSPEQVRGLTLDRRSDLFSLGIVLYEMATHSRPFSGGNDLEMLRAVLDATPPPIESIRPDFPAELSRIINRALSKDRDQRYSSAAEMQWDLERFIQSWGRPIGPFQLRELVQHLDQFHEEQQRTTPTGGLPGVAEDEEAPPTQATPSEQREAVMAGAASTSADTTPPPALVSPEVAPPGWPSTPPVAQVQMTPQPPPAIPATPQLRPPMPPQVGPPAIPPQNWQQQSTVPPAAAPPRPSFDPDAWDDGEATILQVPSGIDSLKEALRNQASYAEDSGERTIDSVYNGAAEVPTMLDNVSLPPEMVQQYLNSFHDNPELEKELGPGPSSPNYAPSPPVASKTQPMSPVGPKRPGKKKKTPTWMKVALGLFVGSTVLASVVLTLIYFLYNK